MEGGDEGGEEDVKLELLSLGQNPKRNGCTFVLISTSCQTGNLARARGTSCRDSNWQLTAMNLFTLVTNGRNGIPTGFYGAVSNIEFQLSLRVGTCCSGELAGAVYVTHVHICVKC